MVSLNPNVLEQSLAIEENQLRSKEESCDVYKDADPTLHRIVSKMLALLREKETNQTRRTFLVGLPSPVKRIFRVNLFVCSLSSLTEVRISPLAWIKRSSISSQSMSRFKASSASFSRPRACSHLGESGHP